MTLYLALYARSIQTTSPPQEAVARSSGRIITVPPAGRLGVQSVGAAGRSEADSRLPNAADKTDPNGRRRRRRRPIDDARETAEADQAPAQQCRRRPATPAGARGTPG